VPLVLYLLAYAFQKSWSVLMELALFVCLLAGAVSVGLMVTTAHAVDQATFTGNDNSGQTVYVSAATWIGGTLPIVSLLLLGTVGRWD
jgi:hypothetical protein